MIYIIYIYIYIYIHIIYTHTYIYIYFRKPTSLLLWNTEPLEKNEPFEIENTVIANWFDKFGQARMWDISYNTRWILTAKLNIMEQEVLKVSTSICWLIKFCSCKYATWHFLDHRYEKHPIYIKISTYRCELFNYLIIR